ncbi:AAA family ATPase, partial [Thiotrichales bacterium 19S3-7]|nr:AAA family ATPase [Thiotrichales bacterium 19S3-7]
KASAYFASKSVTDKSIDTLKLIQAVISDEKNKTHLIELDHSAELALYREIHRYSSATSRDTFFVNSPDELALLVPTVKHGLDKTGTVLKAPAGALFEFLKAEHEQDPIIVINYSNFSASEIVRFNSILDDVKKIDGIEIPQNTKIIGIRNQNDPNAYHGSDFLSRFDQRHHITQIDALSSPVRSPEEEEVVEGLVVDLFNSQDWKEILFGRWVINKDQLKYQDGKLIAGSDLLAEHKTLILKNIPQSKEVDAFFKLAKIHGKFNYNGIEIEIPQGFQIINAGKGYDFDTLKGQVTKADNQFNADAISLNPTLLSQFFTQHNIDSEHHTLETLAGILEANQTKTLEINLTRNFTEDQWAKLLTAAKEYNVKLIIHAQNDTEFPFDLALDQSKAATVLLPEVTVIQTNDIQYSVEKLNATDAFESAQLAHITDLKSTDLIKKINGHLNDESLKFVFSETEHYLINAIKANKDIILYGDFDNELADTLIKLLNESSSYTGKLAFVSSNTSAFSAMRIKTEVISAEAKLHALKAKSYDEALVDSLIKYAETESFAQLETRAKYITTHPKTDSDLAWHGLDALSSEIKLDEFDLEHATEKAGLFESQRIKKVTDQLKHNPYVFITGLTGVGKTTTICNHFDKNTDYAFYQNQSAIKDWAKDISSKEKVLFLDEANLTNTNWSEFEGLFNTPPSIFIDGELIELTAKHKVIFAGNPLSYGDERTLAPLFKRHGSAVEFSPMSLEFIYDRILKPVFKGSDFEGDEAKLLLPILDVYQYLCSLSKDEVLISPRELQMMALLTLNASITDPTNCVNYAKFYSYSLGKNVLPKGKVAEFEKLFNCQRPIKLDDLDLVDIEDSFVVTESRKPIKQMINDLLDLRLLKRTQKHLSDYSGLGGMVLEGEPGIGKSEIVIKTMLENGLKEGKDFYKLPISMPLAEKQKLLLKAFNEGAIVMIDEINSAPMLEELLNALLMGKNLQGERAENPGFMVIGTQNPASLSGRRVASQALERRLIKVDLPPYTATEMQMILKASGFKEAEA